MNVLLTPNGTANGGVYNVQVTSVGESGTGFVALQDKSKPQSNAGQVVDIRISLAGKGDVTGKTANDQTVIVGQQIALTASLPGASMSNPAWTITPGPAGQGGMYVGGYSNGKGGPPDDNYGQVDPLVTNQPSMTYYYTAANTSTVTFSATVNGTNYSRTTGFNVVAPTGTFTAVSLGKGGIAVAPPSQCPQADGSSYQCVEFGPAPSRQPGMNFGYSYTIPRAYAGSFQFVQAGTSSVGATDVSGKAMSGTCPSQALQMGLDTAYPYPSAGPGNTNHSPSAPLLVGYSAKQRSDVCYGCDVPTDSA